MPGVITVQGHPEFTPAYSRALMERRRDSLGETVYQTGIASLNTGLDAHTVVQWIVNFIRMPSHGS